ncbi:MAG TPA: 5-oxoprolinase subunit PxpA [Pseudonocardiaceae bacterium]|nr:5-oxoprolinase subunit PxpA [Pseudonocardiaceae bacterium]
MMVDLAADLGEGYGTYRVGDDDALLGIVTSANIACGFHAGDPAIMHDTVAECVRRGVQVGAHPGLHDRYGFGRRLIGLTAHEVYTDVLYQLGALDAFARARGTRIRHVTPHGQLGNAAVRDRTWADAIVAAITAFDADVTVVALAGALTDAAAAAGLSTAVLGLADRAYQEDGSLVPRSTPGAVLTDESEVTGRVVRMVTEGMVTAASGRDIPLRPDTVLLHGDTPGAVVLAKAVRAALADAGVAIRQLAALV